MQVELVNVDDVVEHPKNPRQHPESAIVKLVRSIGEFGWTNPILVDRDGQVLAGNARLKAAKKAGIVQVPIIRLDLSGREAETYMIADNRIQEETDWDWPALADLLEELDTGDLDLTVTGFDEGDLESLLTAAGPGGESAQAQEVETPDPPEDPETQPGDLWHLGDHRLLCGDATKPEDLARLMAGDTAGLVWTDPPYNLAGEAQLVAAQSIRDNYGRLKASDWDQDFDLAPALHALEDVMAQDVAVYVCTSQFLAPAIWAWMATWSDFYYYCVWVKPNPMPSLTKRHWTWGTELICYATRGNHVFSFPGQGHALNWWQINAQAHATGHPTEKPVALPAHVLPRASRPKMNVLDPFAGAGSTLLAAEQLDRRAFCLEIDPGYCDVIRWRWETLTGRTATRERRPDNVGGST